MNDYSDKNSILDEVKRRYNCDTDGDLMRLLDISRTRLSNYRNLQITFDDDVSDKLEKLLELPEGVISLEMHAKRSKCPAVSARFHDLAQKLAAGALCLTLCFASLFHAPSAAAATPTAKLADLTIIYIMRT
jgi:hypothetical protein